MCGICGVFVERRPSELHDIVSTMTSALSHRGPDAQGINIGERWAIGHARLSIIALADGAQPMSDERGFTISYNGELYNYRELRSELEADGEIFRTGSDTEVVLRAYARWGRACLRKFNGMFAFAITNSKDHDLFLARDPIGIKPLYYSEISNGLVFGSEIKALLKSGLVDGCIDLSLVPFYLSYGYFPREFTPYKYIRQLRPGHWLHFRNGKISSDCYWSASRFCQNGRRRITVEDELDLVQLIADAVKKQTVADVPIGVLLSGGLDSAIVTASLAKTGTNVRTFTLCFPTHSEFDEGTKARALAARYGTEHNEMIVNANEARQYWESLLDHFDQPFADDSALNNYLISKCVRARVKVALSGDGGDEQWGGYQNYRRYLQVRSWQHAPCRQALRRAIDRLTDNAAVRWPAIVTKAAFYAKLLATDNGELYDRLDVIADPVLVKRLCGDRVRPYLKNRTDERLGTSEDLDAIMLNDIQGFMVDDVLRKVDMTSMAVGLEVRVPLLDHRIVEKSLELSWRDKVSNSETKVFIRRLFKPDLPVSIIRGKKRGFGVPLNDWLRGPMRDVVEETLLSKACQRREVLAADIVHDVTEGLLSGRRQNGKLIYAMIALERWLQHHDN